MAVAKGAPILFPPPLITFPYPLPTFRQKLMTSASVEGTLASVEGVPVSVEGTSARAVMTLADAADFSAATEVIFRHVFCHCGAPESVIKTSGGQSKTEFVARNAGIVMCNTEIGSCNTEIMVCNDRFRP